jgi:hypothetical protein
MRLCEELRGDVMSETCGGYGTLYIGDLGLPGDFAGAACQCCDFVDLKRMMRLLRS